MPRTTHKYPSTEGLEKGRRRYGPYVLLDKESVPMHGPECECTSLRVARQLAVSLRQAPGWIVGIGIRYCYRNMSGRPGAAIEVVDKPR